MSGATYRIEMRHEPEHSEAMPYGAYIYRLSDDRMMCVRSGRDIADALRRAEQTIYAMTHSEENATYYTDDNGTRLGNDPSLYSVKV